MKQISTYSYKEEGEDEERFYVVLTCGCTWPVPPDVLFEDDVPCPVHEEARFTGVKPPAIGGYIGE
jgi:hypothetical protein